MTCPPCGSSKQPATHGVYSFKCPECAARCLSAAWPLGKATKAHRLVYTRHRQAVQEAIAQAVHKHKKHAILALLV